MYRQSTIKLTLPKMTDIIEISSDSSIRDDEGSSASLYSPYNTEKTASFEDTVSIKVIIEGQYLSIIYM